MFSRILLIIIIFACCTNSAVANSYGRFAILGTTFVEVHGTTNISKFKLTYDDDRQNNTTHPLPIVTDENCSIIVNTKLPLEIKKFRSHNPIAEKGFYKLLNGAKFPFMLVAADSIGISDINNNCKQEKVRVRVTITGITKEYLIPYQQNFNNNLLIIEGNVQISISDFGLTPPDDILGIVKTSEWVVINLKMEFKIQ